MRLYELYSYEGDGMIREQRGTEYEVREAQNLDRSARRDLLRWEREKPHAARPAGAEGQSA